MRLTKRSRELVPVIFREDEVGVQGRTTVVDLPNSPTYCCYTTSGNNYCRIGQGSAPAHRARHTIKLLRRETPKLIPSDFWPPDGLDFSPVDCQIWGIMQAYVYQTPVQDVTDLRQRLIDPWISACRRALWMMLLTKGGRD